VVLAGEVDTCSDAKRNTFRFRGDKPASADNRNQDVAGPDALFDCLNKVDPRIEVIDIDENFILGKASCKPVIQASS